MTDAPQYRLYRTPRFSANHLSSYITARGAAQRKRVIRDAKFQKKQPTAAYSEARRTLRDFLPRSTRDLKYFDAHIAKVDARLRTEPEGWRRDELERTKEAIYAFKSTYTLRRVRAYTFTIGPTDLTMEVSGVRLNTRLDVGLMETDENGDGYTGGCVLFMSSTDEARRNIEERRKIVAAMVYWSLQENSKQVAPLPRLCMSFDVFGQEITKASKSIDRFREQVTASCGEAASMWDRVEPPPGYDGPDWR